MRRIAWLSLLSALALMGWLVLRSDGPRSLLLRWFGPPTVDSTEIYAGDRGEATFDHSGLDRLLAEFVDEAGRVDYEGIAGRRDELSRYIDSLAAAPFESLGRNEKLALLINAYNAFTLELILEHYPLDSVRDIPEDDRWKAIRWTVAGQVYSLDRIEHEEIRPKFREPRVHFALVCAAVGCPPLRREAYVGDRLEAQLNEQAVRVHGDERWVRYEPGSETIELTSLYEWFRGDFEQDAGSILDFVARYLPELPADDRPKVRFLDYDWSLNAQRGATP